MKALQAAICDWGSRQNVGDESPRGVIPTAVSQAVKKRLTHGGCCSPEIPLDARLGEVRYIAPHSRGGECFDRDVTVTPALLKF